MRVLDNRNRYTIPIYFVNVHPSRWFDYATYSNYFSGHILDGINLAYRGMTVMMISRPLPYECALWITPLEPGSLPGESLYRVYAVTPEYLREEMRPNGPACFTPATDYSQYP